MYAFLNLLKNAEPLRWISLAHSAEDSLRQPKEILEFCTGLLHSGIPFAYEVSRPISGGRNTHISMATAAQAFPFLTHLTLRTWPNVRIHSENHDGISYEGGSIEGAYFQKKSLQTQSSGKRIEILTPDDSFPKLELVGEGISLQVSCRRGGTPGKMLCTVRLLACAPAPKHAKNLLSAAAKSFKMFQLVGIKNQIFLRQFAKAEFASEQSVSINAEELANILSLSQQ